jgi:hypothetical protein
MFGLDQDFSAFYQAARGELKLRQARKLAHGRVLRSPTFFEDVLKTILTTNALWGATKRMNLNLIETFGTAADGSTSKAFHRPERLAASTPAVLRAKVRVGYACNPRACVAAKVGHRSVQPSPLPTRLRRTTQDRGVGPQQQPADDLGARTSSQSTHAREGGLTKWHRGGRHRSSRKGVPQVGRI